MTKLTLAGVRGHIVRFLLTACAVMLGVSFVTGTFVLRDSIDSTLKSLFAQGLKGVDVEVRGVEAKGQQGDFATRAPLPLTLEKSLAAVPGVKRVAPDLQGNVLIAGKDGTAVRNGGAPSLGFAFRADDPSFRLSAGRGPTGPGEVAVEQATLEKSGLHLGDRTRAVVGDQVRSVTITGEVVFGSLFGATAVLVDEASARAAFAADGTVSGFAVTADGVSQEQLRAQISRVLPATAEAVTGATLDAEAQEGLKTGLGFFTTFLLVFAGVALFVGAFIIFNTFSMLLGQRTRELALLRAVGASRGQILRMVLGEAAVIGLLGSALGIGLGILIAMAAKAGIRFALGASIGDDLPIGAGAIGWSVLVGVLVTLAAAVIPGRRASRIAPVAAMRDDLVIAPKGLRLRGALGGALLVVGVAALAYSVTRDDAIWPLAGVGAALAVLGALIAAPLTTRPVVRLIAWPFARFGGVVGRLARENSLRLPRRTALTASALMIGLALITGLSVIAQSVKASVSDIVKSELKSTFVLSAGGQSQVPASVAPAVAKLPQVASVAALGGVGVQLAGSDSFAMATEPGPLLDNFDLTATSGDLRSLDRTHVLVNQTSATEHGWSVGQQVPAQVAALPEKTLTIGGIYADSQLLGDLVIDRSLYDEAVPVSARGDLVLYLAAKPGADIAALRSELTALVQPYLVVSVQNGAEYIDSSASQVDTLLNLLYVMLLFSVIVAVLGIVNTLALSIIERTREIGLLRAVGLGRRQLAGMITIESVATAVFGAVLGAGLGLALGIALQRGLESQGLEVLSVPWLGIVGMLLAASVVGVLAAVLPTIRAVRLNVLGAIATD
ncbi:MAG: FtsX-like permease family protein [Kineosporiaceae bacterium]|nr:FtsX-like permease family protein [Kineosporiaceae bacterium]